VDFDQDKVNSVSLVQEFENGEILARTGTPNAQESEQWMDVIKSNQLPENAGAPTQERGPNDSSLDPDALQSVAFLRTYFLDSEPGSRSDMILRLGAVASGLDYDKLREAFAAGLSNEEIVSNEDRFLSNTPDTVEARTEQVREVATFFGLDIDKMREAAESGVSEAEFVANIDQYTLASK
jgi:hypothetical protein